MDASLPRPDTVTARAVAEKPNDASLKLSADSKPRLQTGVHSVSWEIYRDALVAVLLWLVLFGLVLFVLSMATAQVRPTPEADHVDRPKLLTERHVTTLLRLMPLVPWTWRIR